MVLRGLRWGACNFFMGVMVLNTQAKHLPNNIERELPHIILSIGTEDDDINSTINGILDTDVTLIAGYFAYILGICDKYPSIFQSIILADKETGYDSITLSGMVANEAKGISGADKKRMSIELPIIVTFRMTCRTKVENRPITFSLAIRKSTAVNSY